MKKKIGLIVLMILISICSIGVVNAKEKAFSLTKAETGEKTETTKINKFSYKKDTITSDVTFHKVGDYVTYKLVLKNTTDNTLTIKSVTDNNSDKNVTYSYDSNKGVKIKSGNTLTLLVKAKYSKGETDTNKRTKKLSTTFTINYVDQSGKSGSSNINVNPGTSDKIMLFTGLLVSSLVAILVVLINKKKKISKKATAILMILSLILPIGVSAATSVYNLSFSTTYKVMDKLVITLDINGEKTKKVIDYNTPLSGLEDPEKEGYNFVGWVTSDGKPFDITKPIKGDISIKAKFEEKVAMLDTGRNINIRTKALVWDCPITDADVGDADYQVKHIAKTNKLPENYEVTELKTISLSTSEYPVYIWWDNDRDTLYWYTEASKLMLNSDSSYLFIGFETLQDISLLKYVDTSEVVSMIDMFAYAHISNYSDVKEFDTSKVTNMDGTFRNTNINLNVVSDWNTSNVTNMSDMFADCYDITTLNPIASWDVSKVTNMSWMFYACLGLTDITALNNWNTSSLKNMSYMFSYNTSLSSLAGLEGFKTGKVTDMTSLFEYSDTLSDISAISNWDVKNVTNMYSMFRETNITTLAPLSGWNTSSTTNMGLMFANCPSLTDISAINNWDTSNVRTTVEMFESSPKIFGTISLKGSITYYTDMFKSAATADSSTGVTVNYTSNLSSSINQIVATKSNNSKVYVGSLISE